MITDDGTQKAFRQITAWVKQRVEAEGESTEIVMADIANEALEHFLSDRAFLNGPIADLIRFAAIHAARAMGQRTRGLVPFPAVAASESEAPARRSTGRWWRWLEHVGDRHVRLPEMTREELLEAEQERRERGEHELAVADLWRTLASKLEGGQRVKDRFTAEEIESIAAERARVNAIKSELREATA